VSLRRLATPRVVWEREEKTSKGGSTPLRLRLVQVGEDNGFPDDGMYVLETSTTRDALGAPIWGPSRLEALSDPWHDLEPLLRGLARTLAEKK